MSAVDHPFTHADVLLDTPAAYKQGLFRAVGQAWAAHHGLGADEVIRGLEAREALGSTGLGEGVAIPHARTANIDRAIAAFARTASPIEFAAPDSKPVDCFVFLLVPLEATAEHLRFLGHVAQKLSDPAIREKLRAATTAERVHDLFIDRPAATQGTGAKASSRAPN